MTDTCHRDCSDEHCFWMMPTDICQLASQRARALDPGRIMNECELSDTIEAVYEPDAFILSGGLWVPTSEKGDHMPSQS